MVRNGNLSAARMARNDEFYTLTSDVESELAYYTKHFRDKVIYCNCDDPEKSAFWKFLSCMFDEYGLRRLVATQYTPGMAGSVHILERGLCGAIRTESPLGSDGDFRSGACIELLESADIVITNPPFSLFHEYIAQLMVYKKKFLVIGSMNAITYKDFFPLLKANRVWLGYHHPKRFLQPDGSLKSFGNILWYTNLDIEKRHVPLDLKCGYDPVRHPRYVNYNAIECGRVADIPLDYFDDSGVPITFLDRYCPEQFEIIGISRELGRSMREIATPGTYEPGGVRFYLEDGMSGNGLKYRRLYDRIVIRRIQ